MTDKMINDLQAFAPKLLYAVLIMVIGIVFSKLLLKLLKKAFKKSKLDPLSHKFILSLTRIVLYVLTAIISLSMLGVDMTSIIAVLGVAGLAISLAIQDSLANVAGGIILLMSKPFHVGDYVELDTVSGTVRQINILQTKLITFDNKVIYIPNGQVTSAKIINYSAQDSRRLDLSFSISYSEDFEKVKAVIYDIVSKNTLSLLDPSPIIRVGELQSSTVQIFCRVWVLKDNYWDLNYDLIEQILTAFKKENISIPFNQLDVHIKNQ